jgi:hypothetical protein
MVTQGLREAGIAKRNALRPREIRRAAPEIVGFSK